ncbi:MAG TPA: flotillin family protein [Ktedonobacteraceae bacterium]|nr:flotillin family protein [Ktedonobacteraceae bacterium]
MDTSILFMSGGILICIIFIVLMMFVYAKTLRKVGPNQAMIVYGAGGIKVISGGAYFIIPLYQRAKYFSLELMSFTVNLVQELYLDEQGTYVSIEAVVLVKVRTGEQNLSRNIEQVLSKGQATRQDLLRVMNENSAERNILKAAEMFLSKSQPEREELIRTVIEGHLRGIIGQSTFEGLVRGREDIAQEVFKATTADLDRMGLEMVSFTIKDIHRWAPEQMPTYETNETSLDG